MTPRDTALAVATALLLAASCGGGGGKAATTTSAPPSSEETTSSSEPVTTSSTIDPTLKDLLLVAADLPGFKDAGSPEPGDTLFKTCDPAEAPAFKALNDAPKAEGDSLERGKGPVVGVGSTVFSMTPEQAEAGLTELLDPKVLSCLQKDLEAAGTKSLPAGATGAVKLTSAKATVAGVDQTVLISAIVTLTQGGKTVTLRTDGVYLRSAGTVLEVDYSGPTAVALPAERQKIVAVAARKLVAAASGTTSPTGGGSSTSSTRGSGSSTTKRSTTSTRQGSTTSTTKKANTTSSSTP